MASRYLTDGRVRMKRVEAGFLRCNDIVKEFVEIKISERLGLPRADFQTTTWRQWCHDNIAFIRGYQLWRNQAKEEDAGEEIPIFDEVDITFFSYLMREIAPDCPGFVESLNHLSDSVYDMLQDSIEFSIHQPVILSVCLSYCISLC